MPISNICLFAIICIGPTLAKKPPPTAGQFLIKIRDSELVGFDAMKTWEEHPAKPPKIFILLTMAIDINIGKLAYQYDKIGIQKRNTTERLAIYERTMLNWATKSSLPLIVVESTGASLESLRSKVPKHRKRDVEFISFRNTEDLNDVGVAESLSVLKGLDRSLTLRNISESDIGC